jgi:hypothetical protein
MGLPGKRYRIDGPNLGVLHFQFSNWRSVVLKHYWYRALERIRMPEKSIDLINARYDSSLDEAGLLVSVSLEDWFRWYDLDVRELMVPKSYWRARELISWRDQHSSLLTDRLPIDWRLVSELATK